MSINEYIRLKKDAVHLPDVGGFDINTGEMNPIIAKRFCNRLKGSRSSTTIWEPFAGTSFSLSSGINIMHGVAKEVGVKLISYGLEPVDDRVIVKNSVENGPEETINGMLFHPPYWGSSLMSDSPDDLSGIDNEDEYRHKLSCVIDNGVDFMAAGGLVCAIGRDYRHNGKRIRLDLWYLDLFEKRGFVLKEVWTSSPDIVLILELAA